jgi:hypothetical protein
MKRKTLFLFSSLLILFLMSFTPNLVKADENSDENYPPIAEADGPWIVDPYPFGFYITFEGCTVTFDASGSYDPDGVIVWYGWYFIYPNPNPPPDWLVEFSLQGQNPVITYSWNEPYESLISLWVMDDCGFMAEDLAYVTVFDVPIDIKPGSYPNSINPKSKGVIPVAILNENYFIPEWVIPDSARFGPSEAAPVHWAYEDVDGDEDIDLILHFKTQEAGFEEGDEMGTLTADFINEYGENTIHAEDSVRIVPHKSKI